MENAVTVKSLTKKYQGFTLNNISFQIPKGCIVGFVGENGAGKSTTILSILGVIPRDEGEVELLGHKIRPRKEGTNTFDPSADESWREQIGVVFDECNFSTVLNVKLISKIMENVYHVDFYK